MTSAACGCTDSSNASRTRTPTSSPLTGSASRSSTPSSETDSSDPCSTPTNHLQKPKSDKRSEPSRTRSLTTFTPPDSHRQNRTRHNVTTSGPQVELDNLLDEVTDADGAGLKHPSVDPAQ